MFKVFVYGTLKKGYPLFDGDVVSEVEEDSLDNYSIYQEPRCFFPFLLEETGGVAHGEVHTFDEDWYLRKLDFIEGDGRIYQRVEVITNNGHKAYAYVAIIVLKNPSRVEGQWERGDYNE